MDNFGELIYILIFATIIIKGLFDSFRKQASQEDAPLPSFDPKQNPKGQNVLQELKDMLNLPDENEEEDKDNVLLETSTEDSIQNNFLEDNQERSINHLKLDKISVKPEKKEATTKNQQNIREFVKLKNINDLKRAVIYSEILNRKY